MKSKSFNLKKWAKSRAGQQVFICIGFMIIPLLLLFLFTYFPFAEMIKFSFYRLINLRNTIMHNRPARICRMGQLS